VVFHLLSFAGALPKRVLPVTVISGLDFTISFERRKYSCSMPAKTFICFAVLFPSSF
jgi:hypothetical protein